MNKQSELNWNAILQRANLFPEEAFQFVREGLARTVQSEHGPLEEGEAEMLMDESRHVGGKELCHGLRELAIDKYGMLARTVLRKWSITKTEDFGVIVYALIERGELRAGSDDSLDDFKSVYDFDSAFIGFPQHI